ncbi:MAG TPA: lipase maturation factor family protein [Terriglobales bacterium]|nr:lipase maturation factor family protein [Terriglobales bacterium]
MGETGLHGPLLVFDGDCAFCRAWVEYGKSLTGDQVSYAPFQEVGERFPQVSREEFASAAKLILPNREVRSGAHAVFSVLAAVPGRKWMLRSYDRIPGVSPLCEAVYRTIARHRSLGFWVTRLLWGVPVRPETYRLTSWLFLRFLGAIYLMAFVSFGVQAAGLVGSHGILPAGEFLSAVRDSLGTSAYWNVPTVLWLSGSDAFLRGVWIAGVCLSLLQLLGVNLRLVRGGLFVLYLSLSTAGQVFMSYQWDALLLEAGFLALFLGSEVVIVRLFRWLLCRLMFLSGAVKLLSGDPSWRHFTALPVHYETQPLPTPLAWYFYQLPGWFQRVSVGFMFFVELLVPLLVLAPRRVRMFAGLAITLLQLLIFLTGNYAFFNLLTVSLCLFVLDDTALSRLLPKIVVRRLAEHPNAVRTPIWRAVCGLVAAFVLFTSGFEMAGELSGRHWAPAEAVIRAVAPFEIVNTYGLFAVMTTTRPEIIVEGSNDGTTWLAYEFKYKPGDLRRAPVWVQPHQPRLDWQMWFAALGSYQTDPWILHFLARLLQGEPEVLDLLGHNPFPGAPPHYIRALVYEYRFTTPAEKKATGEWWKRELKGSYVPVLSLRGP